MISIFYNNTGQTTLEILLVVVLVIILIVGALSSWSWFNRTMVERLEVYNASRLAAIHDIRSPQFGMNISYDRPSLNIFSLDASINDPTPPEGATWPGEDYGICSDNFYDSMAIVDEIRGEVQLLDEEITDIIGENFNLKNDLGSNVAAVRICPPAVVSDDLFMEWIYNGAVNLDQFFNNPFSAIGVQLGIRIAQAAVGGCNVSFWRPSWPGGEVINVVDEYISPGINLENSGAGLAQDRNTKQEEADDLESQAWVDFYDCADYEPPIDECYEQCKHFQEEAEGLTGQALVARASGALGEAELIEEQAQQAQQDFNDCYDGCNR